MLHQGPLNGGSTVLELFQTPLSSLLPAWKFDADLLRNCVQVKKCLTIDGASCVIQFSTPRCNIHYVLFMCSNQTKQRLTQVMFKILLSSKI
jgi:hypothetical protein